MRICIQSLEKMQIKAQKFFLLQKFNMGIKHAEFYADINPLKKV
jgi:hypothetical protein